MTIILFCTCKGIVLNNIHRPFAPNNISNPVSTKLRAGRYYNSQPCMCGSYAKSGHGAGESPRLHRLTWGNRVEIHEESQTSVLVFHSF